MSDSSPNRIAEFRKLRRMTQQQLAEVLGAHWITISKLERGKLPLTFEWAERIGKALNIGEYDVFKTSFSTNTVHVDGVITDGAQAFYFKDQDGIAEPESYIVEVETAQSPLKDWFIIDNDAFFPFFQTDDIIQASIVDLDEVDLYINKLCVVTMPAEEDGKLKSHLGFLVSGRKNQFDLNILGGAPMRNIKMVSVKPVTLALFNPPVWDQRRHKPKKR